MDKEIGNYTIIFPKIEAIIGTQIFCAFASENSFLLEFDAF